MPVHSNIDGSAGDDDDENKVDNPAAIQKSKGFE